MPRNRFKCKDTPMLDKACRVCSDKATGYNFNVITCESCKAFFRRNVNKKKELKCPYAEDCNINTVSRRFCQKCRIKKCLDVGMNPNWILTEEQLRMRKNHRFLKLDMLKKKAADKASNTKEVKDEEVPQQDPHQSSHAPSPMPPPQHSPSPAQMMSLPASPFHFSPASFSPAPFSPHPIDQHRPHRGPGHAYPFYSPPESPFGGHMPHIGHGHSHGHGRSWSGPERFDPPDFRVMDQRDMVSIPREMLRRLLQANPKYSCRCSCSCGKFAPNMPIVQQIDRNQPSRGHQSSERHESFGSNYQGDHHTTIMQLH